MKLRFYAGAVTRANTLDLAVIKRGVSEPITQNGVHFIVGIADPTGNLGQNVGLARKREAMMAIIAVLASKFVEVNCASIEAKRSTSLHSRNFDSVAGDRFGEMQTCGLGNASTSDLSSSNVH